MSFSPVVEKAPWALPAGGFFKSHVAARVRVSKQSRYFLFLQPLRYLNRCSFTFPQ